MLILYILLSFPILVFEGTWLGLVLTALAAPCVVYGAIGGYRSVEGLLVLLRAVPPRGTSTRPARAGVRDVAELIVFAHLLVGPSYLKVAPIDDYAYPVVLMIGVLSGLLAFVNNRWGRYGTRALVA